MKTMIKSVITAGLFLAAPLTVRGVVQFLNGSTLPTLPWTFYQDGGLVGETVVTNFFDPELGGTNQALRVNSDVNSSEWYIGAFTADEIMGGGRFRLVEFGPTGIENLLCVTTSPSLITTNAPAPSITLVDGRYKLWTYVDPPFGAGNPGSEILDIGPAVTNAWHTAYIYTHKDGKTKLWWDGVLIFDGTAPPANPSGGYFEWGSGSWQYDAITTVDFDWVGYTDAGIAPILVSTVPEGGAPFHNAAAGFSFSVLKSAYGVASNGVAILVDGVDRTGDLLITGNTTNRQGSLGGLLPNRFYNVILKVTDLAANVLTNTINFQTFSQTNFMFEAEDWNFDGGQRLDTVVLSSIPGPNNYVERTDVEDVDQNELSTDPGASGHQYRGTSLVGTEETGDFLRQKYINAQVTDPDVADYNVGWVDVTEWLNYTRTFPTGEYHIYGRLASGNPGPFEASIAKVTGATTTNQTTTPLGSFKGDVGHGWQQYTLIPLTDAQSNRVAVSLSGVETLRVTATSGGYNANFYMLATAERPVLNIRRSGGNVVISWYQLIGETYVLEFAPTVLGPWTNVVNQSNPYTVSATGSSRFFRLAPPPIPPPPTDVVVTFNDLPDGVVPGSYAGLDWTLGVWTVGGAYGGILSKNAYQSDSSSASTNRISGGVGGTFLFKSLRASANSGWTISLLDNNGQVASLVLTAGTAATLTTGWTTNSAWVDVTSSVGWDEVIDDLTYSR